MAAGGGRGRKDAVGELSDVLRERIEEKMEKKKASLVFLNIGDAGAVYVAEKLRGDTVVEELQMYGCGIGSVGAHALAGSLSEHNARLKELNLSKNESIGDSAVEAMGEMLQKNTTLERLYLSKCGFGPRGARALGEALMENNSLKDLYLDGNEMGKERWNGSLSTIYVNDCKLTEVGTAADLVRREKREKVVNRSGLVEEEAEDMLQVIAYEHRPGEPPARVAVGAFPRDMSAVDVIVAVCQAVMLKAHAEVSVTKPGRQVKIPSEEVSVLGDMAVSATSTRVVLNVRRADGAAALLSALRESNSTLTGLYLGPEDNYNFYYKINDEIKTSIKALLKENKAVRPETAERRARCLLFCCLTLAPSAHEHVVPSIGAVPVPVMQCAVEHAGELHVAKRFEVGNRVAGQSSAGVRGRSASSADEDLAT